jgi:hypothetical protein
MQNVCKERHSAEAFVVRDGKNVTAAVLRRIAQQGALRDSRARDSDKRNGLQYFFL